MGGRLRRRLPLRVAALLDGVTNRERYIESLEALETVPFLLACSSFDRNRVSLPVPPVRLGELNIQRRR